MVKVSRQYTVQELIDERTSRTASALDGAKSIEITRKADGRDVVSLPLPDKLRVSVYFLGDESNLIETILTFKFANMQARYRVIGVSDDGISLIGELIQQSEKRLAPLSHRAATTGER
jgi:hypothetical protein